jgi:hypothetical protein
MHPSKERLRSHVEKYHDECGVTRCIGGGYCIFNLGDICLGIRSGEFHTKAGNITTHCSLN